MSCGSVLSKSLRSMKTGALVRVISAPPGIITLAFGAEAGGVPDFRFDFRPVFASSTSAKYFPQV
jgi:hypothetical protein